MVVSPGLYPVPPLQCYDTIQSLSDCRYMDHQFLATTERWSLGRFPAWLLKTWPTSVFSQDSFDSVREARGSLLFKDCMYSWKLERTQKNPEKTQFQVRLWHFRGEKPVNAYFVMF